MEPTIEHIFKKNINAHNCYQKYFYSQLVDVAYNPAKHQKIKQPIQCNCRNIKSSIADSVEVPYMWNWKKNHKKSMNLFITGSDVKTLFTKFTNFYFSIFEKQKIMKVSLIGNPGYCFLYTRSMIIILLSVILLLTAAQSVNCQIDPKSVAISSLSNFSDFKRNSPTTLGIRTDDTNVHAIEVKRKPIENNEEGLTMDFATLPTLQSAGGSSRKIDSSLTQGMYSSTAKTNINRNILIREGNLLQRQLREKAKQDSLESIKMHILIRLNLKILPNITTPISVPQSILEDFYKQYNASLSGSIWHRNSGTIKQGTMIKNADESMLTNKYENSGPTTSLSNDNDSKENSSQMQSDDSNAFKEFQWISSEFGTASSGRNSEQYYEEFENILSHIRSIYVFPEQSHIRHNKRVDVLRFKFDSRYSDISYATLHIYIRGWDWIHEHLPDTYKENARQKREIIVAVHRALRQANSTTYTHKAKVLEFRHKIPTGLGQWASIDLMPLFGSLIDVSSKSQEILITGVETWMKPLVVTTDNTSNNPLTVHIEIGSQKKHRRKRSVYMDCTEADQDMRCCRYPLKVNFTTFGWTFVVAPTSFDAYFCSGDCRVGYLEQYTHTHLASLTTSASPCCSPTKMSSLSLLYFDNNKNLVLSVIPNMSVEGCSCS